ncbi:hypothetical protein O3M35_011093 [Rhynocoris fuscipes]|uniref:Uncharacterized protein n=1 Tax=Rhynocoris fuscipes TaxID=488301 RepID=A0AAW1CWB8_9HEMI
MPNVNYMGGTKRTKKENYDRKGKKKRKEEEDEPYEEILDVNEEDGVPDAAKKNVETTDQGANEDEFGAKDYRTQVELKPDHESRPLWVGGPTKPRPKNGKNGCRPAHRSLQAEYPYEQYASCR